MHRKRIVTLCLLLMGASTAMTTPPPLKPALPDRWKILSCLPLATEVRLCSAGTNPSSEVRSSRGTRFGTFDPVPQTSY